MIRRTAVTAPPPADDAADAVGDPWAPLTFDVLLAGPDDGPPVVLLHGFPQDAWAWTAQLTALAEAGLRAIAPSQRGYSPGASPDDPAAYQLPLVVGDVIGLLDALEVDRAHVVGHDWGGAVAWVLAARHPDRVRSLTVLATPHPVALRRSVQRSLQARLRFAYMLLLRQPGSSRLLGAAGGAPLRAVCRAMGLPPDAPLVTDPAVLHTAQHWYRATSPTATGDLPRIQVPTRFLSADRDPVFTERAAVDSGRECDGPYSRLAFPRAGHWLAHTSADEVSQAIIGHVTAVG